MNKYRLSEQFFSIQGEGTYAGQPSLWARVFGCNLKCPGFPCDTEYSWNPAFKDGSNTYTAIEIVDNWIEMLKTPSNPEGLFRHPITKNDIHFVLTGGEPLLVKYQKMLMEILGVLNERNVNNTPIFITIETNGTQALTPEFIIALEDQYERSPYFEIFFSISPKLHTVSGEVDAVDYDNIIHILTDYPGQLKFVCSDSVECEEELDLVVSVLNAKRTNITVPFDFWIMPLGTTRDDQLQIAPIVEKYQAKGYKIATRNHTYIWSDAKNR